MTNKVIITSRKNLEAKYGSDGFKKIHKLLTALAKADKKRKLLTKIIFIDDSKSSSDAGINSTQMVSRKSAKEKIDEVFRKLKPAYIAIFGAQDVFSFQEIMNPVVSNDSDNDDVIPTDLPYACDSKYGNDISNFLGPTRVVGRIPDINGKPDVAYVKTVIYSIIRNKFADAEVLNDYFAVSTDTWKRSTAQSLINIFGNSLKMKCSPPSKRDFSKHDFNPLIHFYNCHGSIIDSNFYGQKGNKSFPAALNSMDLNARIPVGTVVSAECCYGAELFDPANEDNNRLSIANTYFLNKAVAFLGSSTIAYGPADGQGLADLITQDFIKNVMNSASTGRALLQARQRFLAFNGPQLDAYELKTLAQFYLLGDPSVSIVKSARSASGSDTIENRRLNLFNKGLILADTIQSSKEEKSQSLRQMRNMPAEIVKIFRGQGFTGNEEEKIYKVQMKNKDVSSFASGVSGKEGIYFRTFTKQVQPVKKGPITSEILVVKESDNEILGWRIYQRK